MRLVHSRGDSRNAPSRIGRKVRTEALGPVEMRHARDTSDTRPTQNDGPLWSWLVNHGQSFSQVGHGVRPLTSTNAKPPERVRFPPPPPIVDTKVLVQG